MGWINTTWGNFTAIGYCRRPCPALGTQVESNGYLGKMDHKGSL
jgi:hypothetical protein